MNKIIKNILIAIVLIVSMSSCKEKRKTESSKLSIATTTGMIADVIQNIVKDSADVIALMGPGVDPHLYKATQGDLIKLQNADLIIYNGLHLEGKLTDILEKVGKEKPTIGLGDKVDQSRIHFIGGKVADPHIWFNVDLWKEAGEVALDFLIQNDQKNAEYYRQNAANYFAKMDELHIWAKEQLATLPKSKRVLITSHDAFEYFGEAYDVKVRGLQGISTVSEFGLKDITDLVNYVCEDNIRSVFIESSVSEKSLNAVIEGVKKRGKEVKIGGQLYSDAMGEPTTEDGTYLGMIKHNVNTIINGLK